MEWNREKLHQVGRIKCGFKEFQNFVLFHAVSNSRERERERGFNRSLIRVLLAYWACIVVDIKRAA
jgi:hypothetical protein